MFMRLCFAAMVVLGLSSTARAADADEQRASVMVLGSYHFANPGRDAVNMAVDDVLTPERQSELAALAAALAEWKPDRIAVEMQSKEPDLSIPDFSRFTTKDLASDRNEIVQIAYRLAHELGQEKVYGFDERPGEGEPDYFPLDDVKAYADANGMSPQYNALFESVRADVAQIERLQASTSIATLLKRENEADRTQSRHSQLYYGLLKIGGVEEQPGAYLNAMWYMRNAKMFAKLDQIAKPGEKVLVLVGAGHLYWLKHFAEQTPGYQFVDPKPWLEKAAAAR